MRPTRKSKPNKSRAGQLASEKQTAANRRNAQQSTGPRTRSGKDAVRGNAVKHGLSAAIVDPEIRAVRDRFSAELYGNDTPTFSAREQVRELAELQLTATRVRAAKAGLLKTASDSSDIDDILKEYRRMDRYERRALSRKRSLLRTMAV